MSQVIVVNAARRRFYCWGWDYWFLLGKLGQRCFKGDCRLMYEPQGPHLRRAAVRQAAR